MASILVLSLNIYLILTGIVQHCLINAKHVCDLDKNKRLILYSVNSFAINHYYILSN